VEHQTVQNHPCCTTTAS